MKDPIERKDATETFAELYDIFDGYPNIVKELHKVYDKILAIPSAENKGEWIEHEHGFWTFVNDKGERDGWIPDYECNLCGARGWKFKTPFCPNCGARMVKGADDEHDK